MLIKLIHIRLILSTLVNFHVIIHYKFFYYLTQLLTKILKVSNKMFDHPNFKLFLKVLTALTVLIAVHQVFWASDDIQPIQPSATINSTVASQVINSTGSQSNNSNVTQVANIYSDDEEPISEEKVTSESEAKSKLDPLDEIISLDLRLKYPKIYASPVPTSEEMLLTLTTKERPLTHRTPMDLIWVIGNSGSMQGEKLRLLKYTLNYLLNLLSSQDRLSIVRFSDSATRLSPLKPVSKLNEKFFNKTINDLYAL